MLNICCIRRRGAGYRWGKIWQESNNDDERKARKRKKKLDRWKTGWQTTGRWKNKRQSTSFLKWIVFSKLFVFLSSCCLLITLIKRHVRQSEEYRDKAQQHEFLVSRDLQCNLDMIANPRVEQTVCRIAFDTYWRSTVREARDCADAGKQCF